MEKFVLPIFEFIVTFVGKDAVLEDYDRVLADVRTASGTIRIGLHAPIGVVQKGKAFRIPKDKEVWVKAIRQNRMEVVIGKTDPAEGVDYSKTQEVVELPF